MSMMTTMTYFGADNDDEMDERERANEMVITNNLFTEPMALNAFIESKLAEDIAAVFGGNSTEAELLSFRRHRCHRRHRHRRTVECVLKPNGIWPPAT